MSGNEHGTDAFVCQHFDEYGVRHAPVDDEDAVHAPADGVNAAGHLRQHAAADDAGRDERVRLRRVDDGDERGGVGLVAQDAADVGHGDEALRAELARDARGCGVGVDVVDVPLRVAPDGGHDRDVALVEHVEDGAHVDLRNLAHVAETLIAHARRECAAFAERRRPYLLYE